MNHDWITFLVTLGGSILIAAVVAVTVTFTAHTAARRWPSGEALSRHARVPFRTLLAVIAIGAAVHTALPDGRDNAWWPGLHLTLRIAAIVTVAWLAASALLFVEGLGLRRYSIDVPDNRMARRLRTQVLIIRRLTVAAVAVVAAAAVLLSFPGVRAVGASLLASAGLISVVAAVAAQSTLGNVIAGIQLAFNDSIRYDDAVIVETEWGWIEEITLTYVVVRLWDDRRMVLPSTYFTTTPFQNWTRTHSELLGSVEFDLDWRVSPGGMRAELDRILPLTDLWDGRVKVLQVTDAINGWVHVRILVTAKDAPTLFDLRCHVRERMIAWLQASDEGGLPRQRVELVDRAAPRGTSREEPAGLFSGDDEADERAARVTGQIPRVTDRVVEEGLAHEGQDGSAQPPART